MPVCSVNGKEPRVARVGGAGGRGGGSEDGEVMGRACRALWAEGVTWAFAMRKVETRECSEEGVV